MDSSRGQVPGAKFDILNWDRTPLVSDAVTSNVGLLWSGMLPYGTYYLHETEKNGSAVSYWYTVTVDENGVRCSSQSTNEPAV